MACFMHGDDHHEGRARPPGCRCGWLPMVAIRIAVHEEVWLHLVPGAMGLCSPAMAVACCDDLLGQCLFVWS